MVSFFPVFLTKIPLYCKWIVDGSYTERQSSIHREALGDPDNLNGEEIFFSAFHIFFLHFCFFELTLIMLWHLYYFYVSVSVCVYV